MNNEEAMKRILKVAGLAGAAGLVAALLLLVASLSRESPLGAGENIEWLLSYLLLLGFPASLLGAVLRPLGATPIVIRVVSILLVGVDWALIAFLVSLAWLAIRHQRRVGA